MLRRLVLLLIIIFNNFIYCYPKMMATVVRSICFLIFFAFNVVEGQSIELKIRTTAYLYQSSHGP